MCNCVCYDVSLCSYYDDLVNNMELIPGITNHYCFESTTVWCSALNYGRWWWFEPAEVPTISFPIRKSKDYVYGIWVYKALDIWKGYYRVKKSLVSYVKPWTEARNNKYMKYHSKLTYQLSFWNVSRKVDYHAGGKWFIHGPKRRKENQLLSLKHSCWLYLV